MFNKILKGYRFTAILFSLILAVSVTFLPAKNKTAYADGRAEAVFELYTGRTLYCKNENMRLPMASTTKIMTALLVIENCDLNRVITVDDRAVGIEGSSIYLKKGEEISVIDLLYGLMLRSGNDSAAALAIHCCGSIEKFTDKMNERAKKIGATDTHFTNPSGLPDSDHYTTAKDLGLIACEAMKNPTFKEIVSTRNYSGKFRSYVNKNKILTSLSGANGVKTGYTVKAGRCLVSSAERDGMDIICVVLNCPDMYERSANLIESAFSNFKLLPINKNKVFMCGKIPCTLNDEYKILIENDAELSYEVVPITQKKYNNAGNEVGKLNIYCKNNLIFTQNLFSIL